MLGESAFREAHGRDGYAVMKSAALPDVAGRMLGLISANLMQRGVAERFLVRLDPGDALVYKGIDYRHGRTTPNPNRWSAHVFMHWVDIDGPHADWAFDRRPGAGVIDFSFSEDQGRST